MNSFQDRNGGVSTYAFSFPSIAVTDIKVTVDDVEQTYLTHYQVDSYSTTSGGTVNFSVGGAATTYKNAAGATVTGNPPATQPLNVRIYRQTKLINTSTGLAAPEADFTPGSSIRAADLDNNQSQIIYATQEERDQTITGPDIKDGVITNAKISNVAEIEVSKLKDGTARQVLQTDAAGTGVEWTSNIDVPGTLDVTGAVDFDSNLNVDGTATLATVDINAGYIDGTPIGVNSASSGTFTELTANSGATVTGALNVTGSATVDNIKLNANEIDTTGGNLTLDPAGGTVIIGDDLTVNGTVDLDNITGDAVVTSGVSSSNTKVYSAKRTEDLFLRQDSTETLASGVAWAANDSTVATTGAIDARVRGLITDVGGFRPIANEASFPTTNPDPDNNAGTIVSITALSADRTASGTTLTAGCQTTAGTQVTITGCPSGQLFKQNYGLLVETTATLNTYTFVRYLADTSSVATISTKATEIGLLGTAATVEDMGILGTADVVADMAILGTTDVVSDMNALAVTSVINNIASVANVSGSVDAIGSDLANNFANITDYGSITGAVSATSGTSDITTVADSIANVNAVGPIAANVTTVAGISSNVTSVAGNATNINTCATNISSITGASTQATNAANSATSAASSATTATTQATNASSSATSAASSATTATAQASTATTQATNAAASAALANTHQLSAKQYRDDASGIKTQSESSVYNLSDSVSSHTAWGDITDVGTTHFASESANVLLTMSKGSSTYNYGSIT